LNERRVGEMKLNSNVYMVAVGNLGEEDGTEVEEFDTALNNRLIHFKYDMTFPEWRKGYADEFVNPYIISFIENNLDFYYRAPDKNGDSKNQDAFPTPRTWTFLSNLIGKESIPTDYMNIIKEMGHAYIGGAVTKFIRYSEDLMALNINDIVERYPQIENQLKKLNRDRKSELLNALKKVDIIKITKDKKKGDKQLENIASFLNLIDPDERVGFLNDLLDNIEISQITSNQALKNFLKNFKDVFERINIFSKS